MQWMCSRAARRVLGGTAGLFILGATGWMAGCAARWDLDYDYGQSRAKQLNRPLLLYFKDWRSSEHRNLVVNVLENSTVAKELSQTVNVELLYNWGPVAKRYNTTKTAEVFIYCQPDGTEIDRLNVGKDPITPQQFVEWLRACRAKYRGTASQPGATTQPAGKA